jgi:predicted DNA binding CopG/RHH family protein
MRRNAELPIRRDARVIFRLTRADLARYRRAAARDGVTLSKWIREACLVRLVAKELLR